jgi:hypothetical protein
MAEEYSFGPTPECLTVEQLAVAKSDRTAMRHLESCSYCRNELALLESFTSAEPSTMEAPAVRWIATEVRRRVVEQTREQSLWERLTGWLPTGGPRWVPAGAFAAIVLLIGSGVYLMRQDRPESGETVWRSASVAVIRPVGDLTAAPADFAWQGVSGARSYRVRLLEVDRTEVWSADTEATQIAIPPGIAVQLQPGRTLLWQVVAQGPAGPIAESNLQSFHISIIIR